jgi:hypothetical protein
MQLVLLRTLTYYVQIDRDNLTKSVSTMEATLQETRKNLYEAHSKQPNQQDLEGVGPVLYCGEEG